jgi:hypothetical protein
MFEVNASANMNSFQAAMNASSPVVTISKLSRLETAATANSVCYFPAKRWLEGRNARHRALAR